MYIYIYAWFKPFQKFFGDYFLFPAQNVSSSVVQLYRVSYKIFQHFQI